MEIDSKMERTASKWQTKPSITPNDEATIKSDIRVLRGLIGKLNSIRSNTLIEIKGMRNVIGAIDESLEIYQSRITELEMKIKPITKLDDEGVRRINLIKKQNIWARKTLSMTPEQMKNELKRLEEKNGSE